MKGVYALTEDIKKEDVKEEEVAQTAEEVVEESNQPSELEEAQARAEEFENKYLRAHAEMQNIQRRANEMVQESLVHALKEEGIEEIPADGAFDHNYHMAIQTLPADDEHPADTIAQVFQKGYKLHDRILRPAMVVVYN